MSESGEWSNCELNPDDVLGSRVRPSLLPGFLNPNYQLPPGRPDSPLKIRIFYEGELYKEFSPHWVRNKAPLTIDESEGVVGDILRLCLEDASWAETNLPFEPCPGLRIMVLDAADDYCRFHGTIKSVEPHTFSQRKTDLTDIRYLIVTAVDFSEALSRNPATEAYNDVREGFMLSDLVGRYCEPLSNADMDPTMGDMVGRYVVYLKTTAQEAAPIIQRNDWVMWVDRGTQRVQLKRRSDSAASVPLTVTDANIWEHFNIGSWHVAPVDAAINNRVIMPWTEALREGTVDVQKDAVVVYGTGTSWLGRVSPGDQFRLAGSQSTYTIDDVLLDGELYLRSPFREEDVTAANFIIIRAQDPAPIQIDDITAQEKMAMMSGDKGELAGVRTYVAPKPSEALTESEAERIAMAYLRPEVFTGRAETDSFRFPWPVQAGMGMDVVRYNFTGTLIFRKIRWTYLGKDPRQPGKPLFKMSISFSDPLVDIDRQIRWILQESTRPRIQNDLKIRERVVVASRALVKDCGQIIDPTKAESELQVSDSCDVIEPIAAEEDSIAEASDSYDTRETPDGPFYTAPSPNQEAYTVGWVGFSRCS